MATVQTSQRHPDEVPQKVVTTTSTGLWRRRFIRAAVVVLVLGVAVGGWAKISFNRIERRALAITEAGTSLNSFLKTYAEAIKLGDVDALLGHYADSYASKNEGLWVEEFQSQADGAKVYQWRVDAPKHYVKSDVRRQTEDHLSRLGSVDQAKFKILSIRELEENSAVIKCVLWIRGNSPQRETLESRTWFRLALRNHMGDWQITEKKLLYGQTVRGEGRGFADITRDAGIDFQARHNPMLMQPEWFPKRFGIMKYSSGGICTGDYDNDGWIDLLFSDGGSTKLYRNLGGGHFEETTVEAGLPGDIVGGTGALMVDLDNDNDQDLLIYRGTGNNYLFRNNGDATFEDVTEGAGVQGVWVATAAAGDYDNDGLVDLYLGRYLDPRVNLPTTNFYTRNGEGNALLHNNGNLRFTDVTEEAGVSDGGLTLGLAWGDYDEDGDQDVYVANDFGRNTLFQNQGDGTFSDVSVESGTINIGYGMSSQFADIDNDGDLDIYVASVHSSQRWLGNSATLYRYLLGSMQEGTIWEDFPLFKEMYQLLGRDWTSLGEEVVKGNTLMLNNGDGTFSDVTEETRVNPHGWYWSSCMFDFDNDTRQDIYTVSGWITGKTADDL